MPSFDIVSNVDLQEVDNAIAGLMREVGQRYDFKGSNCEVTREEGNITILADDNYKLEQIQGMLKAHVTRRKLDAKLLKFETEERASGNAIRQKVVVQQGIASELAKKIVKEIKATKIKVQAAIRGEELRVDGKKRDDLQAVMAKVREMNLDLPLQFINFRD